MNIIDSAICVSVSEDVVQHFLVFLVIPILHGRLFVILSQSSAGGAMFMKI